MTAYKPRAKKRREAKKKRRRDARISKAAREVQSKLLDKLLHDQNPELIFAMLNGDFLVSGYAGVKADCIYVDEASERMFEFTEPICIEEKND
jgi:hypothetical protein